jgi:hypothetical protein
MLCEFFFLSLFFLLYNGMSERMNADRKIRYDDPEDMWSFFGNGFHVCERDGSDITWYLGKPKGEVDEKEVRETMSGAKGIPLGRGEVH